MGDGVEIREFQESDLDAILAFSLRAWDPVFASLREVLGDPIFFRLKPDPCVLRITERVRMGGTGHSNRAPVVRQ